jgi:hypothetical protein
MFRLGTDEAWNQGFEAGRAFRWVKRRARWRTGQSHREKIHWKSGSRAVETLPTSGGSS